MSDVKRFNRALKVAISAAVSVLLVGPIDANASDKTGAAKITANSPGNIRTETCSRPEYPEDSLKQNHQGTVTLRFLIAADGTVKRSIIHTSSGVPALDEAALVGISKCRFNPPIVDGKPVEGWTAIQYVWKPNK